MTTHNARYNPIFCATRAAWSELTTPDARRWYRQQLQLSAAIAGAALAHVRRWLTSREQITVVAPVDPVSDNDLTAIKPTQVSAPPETAALEQGDVPAIEANSDIAASLPEPEFADSEDQSAALELESAVLAATETGTSSDYERLDDWVPLTATDDEPLIEDGIPFDDDLECGSPFQDEEDTSFFKPEDDESDSLLEDDLESDPSLLPPELSARIQDYLQAQELPAETEEESNSDHDPTPAHDYSATGAEFGV